MFKKFFYTFLYVPFKLMEPNPEISLEVFTF